MLTVTSRAAATVRELINPQVHSRAGLRITAEPDEDGYAIAVVTEASDGDIVVNLPGAYIYLDREIASELNFATLVAAESGVGTARFAVIRR